MSRLQNQVAVVTGGSLGIGAAIAKKLASDGASVVVNYARSEAQAKKLVNEIKEEGGKAIAVGADVRKEADIEKLFEAAVKEYGKVDVLVNNAGVYEFAPLGEVTADHIDKQFSLNVTGLILATREAVKRFGDNGGNIVNISSIVATGAIPGGSVYSATKGAVDTFTRVLAAELGPKKIRVNAVSPGATVTEGFQDMDPDGSKSEAYAATVPLGRLGQPDDIANVVAFVASPDAGWISGQILNASGGQRA